MDTLARFRLGAEGNVPDRGLVLFREFLLTGAVSAPEAMSEATALFSEKALEGSEIIDLRRPRGPQRGRTLQELPLHRIEDPGDLREHFGAG